MTTKVVVQNLHVNNTFYNVLTGFTYFGSVVLMDYEGKYFYLKNNRIKRLRLEVSKRINGVLKLF
jgi:hypothetical protein